MYIQKNHQELQELTSKYRGVIGHKVNTQKLTAFKYTSNKRSEILFYIIFFIRKFKTFSRAPQRIKHLGISLTICIGSTSRNLKNTNERKKYINKWRNSPCSCIRRLNIKISVLSNFICRFNAISIKSPVYFVDINKLI